MKDTIDDAKKNIKSLNDNQKKEGKIEDKVNNNIRNLKKIKLKIINL